MSQWRTKTIIFCEEVLDEEVDYYSEYLTEWLTLNVDIKRDTVAVRNNGVFRRILTTFI